MRDLRLEIPINDRKRGQVERGMHHHGQPDSLRDRENRSEQLFITGSLRMLVRPQRVSS